MRITGGKARSIPIKCPKGSVVRPATDRMREAVFSSLGDLVKDASFLDLFAGAGSYGLEAMSRGARSGVFVERDRSALQCIKHNLQMVQKSINSPKGGTPFSVHSQDVFKWLNAKEESHGFTTYDLVFIDPPYSEVEEKGTQILTSLISLLPKDAASFVIFETPSLFEKYPEGYECIKTYGKGREDARCMLLKWNPS